MASELAEPVTVGLFDQGDHEWGEPGEAWNQQFPADEEPINYNGWLLAPSELVFWDDVWQPVGDVWAELQERRRRAGEQEWPHGVPRRLVNIGEQQKPRLRLPPPRRELVGRVRGRRRERRPVRRAGSPRRARAPARLGDDDPDPPPEHHVAPGARR